jgi:hypothetical protein
VALDPKPKPERPRKRSLAESDPPRAARERPEVQSLVEKATRTSEKPAVKTGADVAGGGGTKTLGPGEPPPPEKRG